MAGNSTDSAIAVIGSGVIGLTSAIRLREAGFPVTIYAREQPPHTTSDVAAAYWSPSTLFGPGPLREWAMEGLATLQSLAADPSNDVVFKELYKLNAEGNYVAPQNLPVPARSIPPGEFPNPWTGYCVTVPQIDVPIYMPRLLARFQELGGRLVVTTIQSFDELLDEHSIVVNCAGLGAAALTGDEVYPVRGQVMRIAKPAELNDSMMISADGVGEVTYIIPRSQDCLLGGTYHYGDNRLEPDDAISAGILARCAVLCPAVANPTILEHRVGLRPGRRTVRFEMERINEQKLVIHNYGHGSIGHTLAWGCAAAVTAAVQKSS